VIDAMNGFCIFTFSASGNVIAPCKRASYHNCIIVLRFFDVSGKVRCRFGSHEEYCSMQPVYD
jgi:hypothetical protein